MKFTDSARSDPHPWYREPWPWILFGLPAIAVVASLFTLYLAIRSDDGVISADYYKRGLAINADLRRTQHAAELGLIAEVMIDGMASGDRVRVQLSATQALPPEAALKLAMIHPGRGDADRTVLLARTGGDARHAEYVGQFNEGTAAEKAAAWLVVLETRAWRLDGRVNPQDPAHLILHAPRD
jgi:hypothetical protein